MKNFMFLIIAGITAFQPAGPAAATTHCATGYQKGDSVLPYSPRIISETNPAAGRKKSNRQQTKRGDTLAPKALLSQQDSLDLLRHLKVNYKPLRIAADFKSTMTLGFDREKRLVRNFLNIGIAYYYTFPLAKGEPNGNFGYLYGSVYIPVNRVLSKFTRQDKGLFLFGHGGYGVTDIKILKTEGNPRVLVNGGFVWRAGIDYFFFKGFGVTASTIEGKSWFGGLVFVP